MYRIRRRLNSIFFLRRVHGWRQSRATWCCFRRRMPSIRTRNFGRQNGGHHEACYEKRREQYTRTYYIRLCRGDPQLGAAHAKLSAFLGRTFYSNSEALSCTIAGLAMAMIGGNLGRAFWTIGPGGAGECFLRRLYTTRWRIPAGFPTVRISILTTSCERPSIT